MSKSENYTEVQTSALVAAYEAAGTDLTKAGHEARAAVVTEQANILGKSVRSVRSKLVRENVYIKREATSSVTNGKPEKKEVIAARVAAAFGVEVIDGKEHRLSVDSLAKMNKTDLAVLFHRFNSEVVEDATEDEAETETAETETAETD